MGGGGDIPCRSSYARKEPRENWKATRIALRNEAYGRCYFFLSVRRSFLTSFPEK